MRILPNMQLMHESHSNVFKYAFGADASIRGIGRCMCVDRNWHGLAKLMLAPILCTAKYDILQLALLLQYFPPHKRWARIVARAQQDGEDTFLDSDEFREMVYLQLLLQHVCACRSQPVGVRISLRDIMNLLVKSLNCGLTADHELLRDHLYQIHRSQSLMLLSRNIWLPRTRCPVSNSMDAKSIPTLWFSIFEHRDGVAALDANSGIQPIVQSY